MDIEILIPVAAIIVHLILHSRSKHKKKMRNLVIALSIIAISVVLFVLGLLTGLGGSSDMKNVALTLIYAPVYLSVLSFLVYLPVFNRE